eukprot:403360442
MEQFEIKKLYVENKKIRQQLRILSKNLNDQIEKQFETKNHKMINKGDQLSPQKSSPVHQNMQMDSIVYSLHLQSNQKMINNLEYEYKRLRKLTKKLMLNKDLEFTLPKRIMEIEDQVNCERAKCLDLTKQSRMYDKEITRLIGLQEQGPQNKNSTLLREFLQTKDLIEQAEKDILKQDITKEQTTEKLKLIRLQLDQHKEEQKELDMNPELEMLKIKKQEIERVQSIVKKEQMQLEIDQNILKIDQDLKRKMKEQKRRINTIKKWKNSNKSIVDFKMKENQKTLDNFNQQIQELQIRLDERCKTIKEQRFDIERLVYYIRPENQNELLDYGNDVGYDHDGIIIEEGNEEDQSNLAAAKDLLKELDGFDQNSMSLGGRDITDNMTQQPPPNFEVDSHRSIMIRETIINDHSFNYRERFDPINQNDYIEDEEVKVENIINAIPRAGGDQNEQSIFETQSNSFKIMESRESPQTQNILLNDLEEAKQPYNMNQYVNPLERVRTQQMNKKAPKKVNPLLTANENAMRMFQMRRSDLESENSGNRGSEINQQILGGDTEYLRSNPGHLLVDHNEVNHGYKKTPSQLIKEIYQMDSSSHGGQTLNRNTNANQSQNQLQITNNNMLNVNRLSLDNKISQNSSSYYMFRDSH